MYLRYTSAQQSPAWIRSMNPSTRSLSAFLSGILASASMFRAGAAALALAVVVSACSVNPVTGDREVVLVSEDWELDVGKTQYLPLRQAQGGDYVVDPQVQAYVNEVGQRIAAKSDRKLPYEFHVINDSTPNAWALPGGKISINRGLLTELKDESELAAVLGHEIVHAAARHGAQGQTRGLGLQLGVITASVIGAREGYGQEAQLVSSVGAQLINSRYGRGAELEADRYGMEYMARSGYDPEGAVDLQRTFVELSEGRSNDAFSKLFASHPPSEERVRKNIETAAALPHTGNRGADRYLKNIGTLRKTEKAYELYEQAQAALAKNNKSGAEKLVRQAIRIEPREGHFHSLLGDITRTEGNTRAARAHYDKAISLNPQFYYYYLQRGKINEAEGNQAAALADYQRSMKLLPTGEAQLALGRFAERQGNRQAAGEYYARAAQAGGQVGNDARAGLARLQPAAQTNTRLLVHQGLTPGGVLAIEFINQTSRPLSNIELGIRRTPGAEQQVRRVQGVLQPGERRVIQTGQRMNRAEAARMQIQVLRADAL
ncbi:MAG: peptidase M48 [Gammaproteobacteria bacterium]|nr:MAG: peptidase M48 [Gammaproteobacteria bacterium]